MRNTTIAPIFAWVSTCAMLCSMSVSCRSTDTVGGGGGTTGAGQDGEGATTGSGLGGSVGPIVVKLDGGTSDIGGSVDSETMGPLPSIDANCGVQTSSTKREPVDVLLLLDRSGSMIYSIAEDCCCDAASACPTIFCLDTANCTLRWRGLTAAVKNTLATTTDIRWGLKLYSSSSGSESCNVSNGVDVAIGMDSASTIDSQIAANSPGGSTPTTLAVKVATEYLKTVNDLNNKVILLATDGEPNCGAVGSPNTTDVQGTVDAITAARSAGFPVYVIGIGPSVGDLDNFAIAGGTGKYYPATSAQELANALASISKAVASCTFALSSTPPDINSIAVYLDKNFVPKDDINGWNLDTNNLSVDLNGLYCGKIASGEATTVQVLFGCPGYIPPAIIP